VPQKIAGAVERFRVKFGKEPTTVLMNVYDSLEMIGADSALVIEARGSITRHNFFLGSNVLED
jgi:hypothetical protein